MERLITPLIALLLAVPAHSQLVSSSRCNETMLTGAMNRTTPLSPELVENGRLKFPPAGQGNALCADPNVWRYAAKAENSIPGYQRTLYDQLATLGGLRQIFFTLDMKANEVVALANELLQKGEKLGLVKKNADGSHTVTPATNVWNLPTKTNLDQKKAAVLELLSKAPAQPAGLGPPFHDLHHAAGSKTKAYYQVVLQLRAAVESIAASPVINDPAIKSRAGPAPAASPEPTDSWPIIGTVMFRLASAKGSTTSGKTALDLLDPALSDRVARPHMQAQQMLEKYDELLFVSYGAKGVAGYLDHIDRLIEESKLKAENERLEKERQAAFATNLESYRKTFEEKTIEGLNAGIDQAALAPEKKAELQKEYASGKVVNTGKAFQYTVTGADGKTKVLAETPVPETPEQLTQDGAVLKGKEVAGRILNGQDYLCRLEALIGAITLPDTQLKVEPVTASDGKTIAPMEQVKEDVPLWRKIIDPFHGKMQKYKKHQTHQLSKEAGESSRDRQKVSSYFDGKAAELQTQLDADLFRLKNNPRSDVNKAEEEKKLRDDFNAKKTQLEQQKQTQLGLLEKSSTESQKQGSQKIAETLTAAYDGQIRLQVAALHADYKKDELKRGVIAQEAGLVTWHIDPDSLKNVATSYMTDADVDGYFAANWAAGKDQASVDTCRQALGFEPTDDPKTRLKDPTKRRVDNRCVHDGLLAHLKQFVAQKEEKKPSQDKEPKKEKTGGFFKKVVTGELMKELLPQEKK